MRNQSRSTTLLGPLNTVNLSFFALFPLRLVSSALKKKLALQRQLVHHHHHHLPVPLEEAEEEWTEVWQFHSSFLFFILNFYFLRMGLRYHCTRGIHCLLHRGSCYQEGQVWCSRNRHCSQPRLLVRIACLGEGRIHVHCQQDLQKRSFQLLNWEFDLQNKIFFLPHSTFLFFMKSV